MFLGCFISVRGLFLAIFMGWAARPFRISSTWYGNSGTSSSKQPGRSQVPGLRDGSSNDRRFMQRGRGELAQSRAWKGDGGNVLEALGGKFPYDLTSMPGRPTAWLGL